MWWCCYSDKLLQADKSIKYFSFEGIKCKARIVDIYDGDTCTIVFNYKGDLIKYKARCFGYDSAEMKPLKSIENREEHIKKAHEDKEFFSKLVMYNNGICDVELLNFDKYGRILVKFFGENKNISINDIMIKNNHGYAYDGGRKKNVN